MNGAQQQYRRSRVRSHEISLPLFSICVQILCYDAGLMPLSVHAVIDDWRARSRDELVPRKIPAIFVAEFHDFNFIEMDAREMTGHYRHINTQALPRRFCRQ